MITSRPLCDQWDFATCSLGDQGALHGDRQNHNLTTKVIKNPKSWSYKRSFYMTKWHDQPDDWPRIETIEPIHFPPCTYSSHASITSFEVSSSRTFLNKTLSNIHNFWITPYLAHRAPSTSFAQGTLITTEVIQARPMPSSAIALVSNSIWEQQKRSKSSVSADILNAGEWTQPIGRPIHGWWY